METCPLPGHDHLLTTRNGDQPEWWNVIVIPVTSPAGLASVESAKNYASVKALENVAGSGIGVDGIGEVPTNAYLWFQTLPGAVAHAGPDQTNCMSTLPSGTVVGGAALDDGTGYYEVDAAGDVAAFGAATCYGALTGSHLNKPIVGMAVDRQHRWLLAGGRRTAASSRSMPPFSVQLGGMHLNKPVVGVTATLNGTGYWLVASDGGVFSFNAAFQGSTGGVALTKPVVGIGLDRATGGYSLVASDGGVFCFDAPFEGSAGSITLIKPVGSITRSPTVAATG